MQTVMSSIMRSVMSSAIRSVMNSVMSSAQLSSRKSCASAARALTVLGMLVAAFLNGLGARAQSVSGAGAQSVLGAGPQNNAGAEAQVNSRGRAQNTSRASRNAPRKGWSIYAVQGQVTVHGWEQNLIDRNPGLARFNWSPITAARQGIVVFQQPSQNQRSGPAPYHYLKPQVMSPEQAQAIRQLKEQKAAAQFGHSVQTDVNSRIVTSAPTSTTFTYDKGSNGYGSANGYARGNADSRAKVHGRLISAK